MARPSSYNEETAAEICARIASGESLRSICADDGLPAMATVMRWLGDPDREAFREQYACARDAQADKLAEDILAIADEEVTMIRADKHGTKGDEEGMTEVVFDSTAVARNRLRVDARKWLASKMAPKKYGDKVQQEVTGPNGGPMQIQAMRRTIVDPSNA